jgi:hypothetical protein
VNTCAWCGTTGHLHRTRPIDDPGYSIDPIWLCPDREPYMRRAETKTHQQLTGVPR